MLHFHYELDRIMETIDSSKENINSFLHDLQLSSENKQLLQTKVKSFSKEQLSILPEVLIPTKTRGTTTPHYTNNILWQAFSTRNKFPSHVATSKAFAVQPTTTQEFKMQTPGTWLISKMVYHLSDNVLSQAEIECLNKGKRFGLFVSFMYL